MKCTTILRLLFVEDCGHAKHLPSVLSQRCNAKLQNLLITSAVTNRCLYEW